MISFKTASMKLMIFFALVCNGTNIIAITKNNRTAKNTQQTQKKKGLARRFMHSIKDTIMSPFSLYEEIEDECINQAGKTFQKIKDNLPSQRFKRAAIDASDDFNNNLRQSINKGSKEVHGIIDAFGKTLDKNIAELRTSIDDGSDQAQKIIEKLGKTINQNIIELRQSITEGSDQAEVIIEKIEQAIHNNIALLEKTMDSFLDKSIQDYNKTRYDHYAQIEKLSTIGAAVLVKSICLSACATVGALLLYKNLQHHTGHKSTILATLGATLITGSGYFAQDALASDAMKFKHISDH